MQSILVVMVVALAGGVAVGLQGPLTSLMSQRLGTLESVFIVHLGGTLLAGLLLLAVGGGDLGAWRTVPWYALAAGSLGLVILSAVSYTIPRIGVATSVTLIVAAQLITASFLDQFGFLETAVRPLDQSRLIGMLVLFVGTWLIVR